MPFDTDQWAETLLGHIIKPAVQKQNVIEWFWFSRYHCPQSMDSEDCDISKIPQDFALPNTDIYRSVRFRYSIDSTLVSGFEQQCEPLVQTAGCAISDFRDYDFVGDLGGDRHLGGQRTALRRDHRANLVAGVYHSTSLIVLDALVGPDAQGHYSAEANDSDQNPLHSSFESIHHVFCNITEVPLRV